MKKILFVCMILTTFLAVILLSFGCGHVISPENSELFEEMQTPNEETESSAEEVPSTIGEPLLREEDGALPALSDGEEEETPSPAEAPFRYEEPSSDLEVYQAACARATVNVRCGGGTEYAVLFTLRAGDALPYLWREGEWLAVWTGKRVGYLSAAYAFLTETNGAIERTIRAGLDKLGTPYEWGAPRILNDKGEGNPYFTGKSFDCSSFVQYCFYIGSGIKLGNYTGSQADYTVGERITRYADLRRGDFYFTGSGSISHVVIYLGDHLLLQTYSANGGPVSVTSDERWKGKFLSGRRPDLSVTEQFR